MSDQDGYNGWKNYETWNVALWLSNEEGLYLETREMAQRCADTREDKNARYELADELKEYVDDLAEATCPGCRSGASFVSDLLGGALSEVDWDEIAENLLSELADA